MHRPLQVDLRPFDLESGVTYDVGYLCANFSFPICLSVLDVRDRQTSDVRRASSLNASALCGRGHNNCLTTKFRESVLTDKVRV